MGLARFLFVFLFPCWLQAVFSFVEPPTNVTLHCRNMHNVLHWSYTQLSPELRFRIFIGSTVAEDWLPNEIWVNSTAELQADVSFLSDPENDYYLDITAVIGENESAVTEGPSFSYFKDSVVANQICHLDFPSVNVTTQHPGSVLFRFTHPALVYLYELPSSLNKRKKRSDKLPLFRYEVEIADQERHLNFPCQDGVCEKTIAVDAAQKNHCLKMKGELENIIVQGRQDYCALPREEPPSYLITIYLVGGLLALTVLGLVLFVAYQQWTKPDSALLKSVMFTNPPRQMITEMADEMCIVQEVEPRSPTLSAEDDDEFTTCVHPAAEPELRLRIGVSTEDEGVCDDEDGAINEEPGYIGGRHMEQDEAPLTSGYEKRSVFDELAPGELTSGYRD
ncbi:growth/differentiation factor 10b [Clinocottus analis]|uniref:growth/differentiation factor 10b n=1 Tax=Clinocottus analis TaxID=304258 RepID=UPI0035C1A0F6